MDKQLFTLTLKSCRMVTPATRHLEFIRKDGAKLDYIPGQFVTFHFELDGIGYNRSYSIASIPTETDTIEIAVSYYQGGPGTRLLFAMEPGAEVETTGPFGRLILREEQPKRYILIATGTGITPYRSMLPELHKRLLDPNLEIFILLGVQRQEDLLYGKDFIKFTKDHPRMHFHAFYSEEMPTEATVYEHLGYVQTYFPQLSLNPDEDIIYLCGNPSMIDDAFNLLLDANFATRQVRREKYISPKR